MSFQIISKLLRPYRSAIAAMAVFSLLVSLIQAASPFVSSFLIDKGLIGESFPILTGAILVLTVLNLFSHILQYLQTKKEIQLTNDFSRHLKAAALEHGLRLKPEYFLEHGFYKIIGDALFDIEHIMNVVTSNCMMTVMIILKAVGAAFGLFFLNWRLTLLILPLIPIKCLWNQWTRAKAETLGEKSREAAKSYHTWFSDILSGIFDIKLWNLNSKIISEYTAHIDKIAIIISCKKHTNHSNDRIYFCRSALSARRFLDGKGAGFTRNIGYFSIVFFLFSAPCRRSYGFTCAVYADKA